MYSKRSPPTVPAGIEFPNISMPGRCGIAPSTGINRSRRYSSIVEMACVAVIVQFETQDLRYSPLLQSHREDNTELRLAAHHPSIRLVGLLERIGFDHRPYSRQFGEVQCVFRVGRDSACPAV